jgi:hypothetical protein
LQIGFCEFEKAQGLEALEKDWALERRARHSDRGSSVRSAAATGVRAGKQLLLQFGAMLQSAQQRQLRTRSARRAQMLLQGPNRQKQSIVPCPLHSEKQFRTEPTISSLPLIQVPWCLLLSTERIVASENSHEFPLHSA